PNCGALACDPSVGCVADHLIAGRKILLRTGAHVGSGTDVKVQTRGQIFTSTPPVQGTDADPVLHGGGLRLRSVAGGFGLRFDLPKENWQYLRAPEDNRGFTYRDRSSAAAVHAVIVKDGRLTKVLGSGPNLQLPLASDPEPVDVTLIIGSERYCMSFGGTPQFDANRRFIAEDAPAPGACPPQPHSFRGRFLFSTLHVVRAALALLAVIVPVRSATAAICDQLCPPGQNPCTVSVNLACDSPANFDLGGRPLVIKQGKSLKVTGGDDGGSLTIAAGSVNLEAGAPVPGAWTPPGAGRDPLPPPPGPLAPRA